MQTLDLIDRKILAELMRDATIPIARLADRVGLSQTPCWKRVQKLQARGIIRGRVAIVDQASIGFGLTAFVGIEAGDHSPGWRTSFLNALHQLPQVLEVNRMAGDLDYLLRVVLPDMAAYDSFYHALTQAVAVKRVAAQFVMEQLKADTVLPLNVTTH
ncbi:Lrp/AsnC family transcriptional regulator [Falsirhodobacter algicola]|uniref:AsnC family transcriptional regulator n=1 Tax=Falsirhodobacter algicola TaxID=2692330 RepID=A0A8J8SK30_9RHOB|nr:Lrp/AsnC family transcriptional regulator [Falsirhodobacter algicola]QUS34964.1 AsnC family transcriptional regulator [Falsirhodobacter algicola]